MNQQLASYPTPADAVHAERMNDGFLKVHTPEGPLHVFTQPDLGHPHDHPWPFTTHIIEGGYVEEVYTIHADGSHSMEVVERRPGTSHHVEAGTVHRIISLPMGFCLTKARPGTTERTSGFYDFRPDGIFHRYWHEEQWQRWPRPVA